MKQVAFVLGDSIAVRYSSFLEQFVGDRYRVLRRGSEEAALKQLDVPAGANGGDSRRVLEFLEWYADQEHRETIDVFILNCGLHDIKRDPVTRNLQVEPEEYRRNLSRLAHLAKKIAAHTLWVLTTPVDHERHWAYQKEFLRYDSDVRAYNAIAVEVMGQRGIPCLDLYTFTGHLGSELYCDHVHYTERVRELQAAFIAGSLSLL